MWAFAVQAVCAVSPTAAEMAEARRLGGGEVRGCRAYGTLPGGPRWLQLGPFFSFTYGGKPSAELLKTWELKRASRQIDAQRTEHTLTYTDPKTGLVLRCVGIEYRDFPAVEWVIHLQNTGPADTPILEAIQAMDTPLPLPEAGQPVLHWAKGGVASFDDFAPQETALKPDAKRASPAGRRAIVQSSAAVLQRRQSRRRRGARRRLERRMGGRFLLRSAGRGAQGRHGPHPSACCTRANPSARRGCCWCSTSKIAGGGRTSCGRSS